MVETQKIFGLVGGNLKNSFSKDYFTQKFIAQNLPFSYQNFELKSIAELLPLITKNKLVSGLNITIPFKETIIPYITELHESAAKIGAVNCVKINRNNQKIELIGYNTDAMGFKISLEQFLPKNFTGSALILGTGGASKAVQYVCNQLNIDFTLVTSSDNKLNNNTIGYAQINKAVIDQYSLIINTTPLGMYPNTDDCPPIPFQFLTDKHYCYDLIYLPTETLFLNKAKLHNAHIINGLTMLQKQADFGFEIFTS